VKEATDAANEAERKYDEVRRTYTHSSSSRDPPSTFLTLSASYDITCSDAGEQQLNLVEFCRAV
jgi:hypothetical protein